MKNMNKLNELQYQGLNLLDEVGTVEIALDSQNQMIHVYDTQQIVAPEYNYATKNYVLTDSFYKMAMIIKQKKFLEQHEEMTVDEWVEKIRWIFYSITPVIKLYDQGKMSTINVEKEGISALFYHKYVERLL